MCVSQRIIEKQDDITQRCQKSVKKPYNPKNLLTFKPYNPFLMKIRHLAIIVVMTLAIIPAYAQKGKITGKVISFI